MAQPSITTPFRVTLLKVGECLTEKNVQDLAFLCEDIKPARRELLRNARELFVELQGHGLLNERNVTVLIGWLEELRLLEASKYLKEYCEKYLQNTTQYLEKCIEHEDLLLKYFCATCNCKVCSECALNLHDKSSHDVIKLEDINSEVTRRRSELEKEIEAMGMRGQAVRELWEEKRLFFSECREKIRKQVYRDNITMQEKSEKNKVTLLEKLHEKEMLDFKKLISEKEEIEHVGTILDNVQKHIHEHSSDVLSEMRLICKTKRKCEEIQERIRKQESEVVKRPVDLFYKKVVNDGTFGMLSLRSLIGCVILQENQIVHIFDVRQFSRTVLLVCFDPENSDRIYWRYDVTADDQECPVVMSNIGAWYEEGRQLIFAVGRTVHTVRPRWTGSIYDNIESDSSMKIDNVNEGSWITAISSYESDKGELDEFVLSISDSSVLRFYKLPGEALREIETRELISSITCIAYVNTLAAIIGRNHAEVILVTSDDDVMQNGFLSSPSSSPSTLPVCVIWTGSKWLVLFVSAGDEKRWQVVLYDRTGTLDRICVEGTCGDMDATVSLTRWQDTGFISFANNTVRTFEY